jgi:hypothetical protein
LFVEGVIQGKEQSDLLYKEDAADACQSLLKAGWPVRVKTVCEPLYDRCREVVPGQYVIQIIDMKKLEIGRAHV